MALEPVFIAIDEGTTSTRAAAFNVSGRLVASHAQAFQQSFPQPGWVEHDAQEIFDAVCATLSATLHDIPSGAAQGIGIANQRESVVVWSRGTGKPLAPAIVWQDRRTADHCAALVAEGLEEMVSAKTGLLLDPYFSATKINWLLRSIDGAQALIDAGDLLAGTIDAYLAYRLTGEHITDHSNASRTSLYNIQDGAWDEALCSLFEVPPSILPRIVDSYGQLGVIKPGLPGAGIPLCGIAGDQQAATIGQACMTPGAAKATYGTGCFVMLNTGDEIVRSKNRLLSTVLYGANGKRQFALEGSIFVAGSLVQWLRDSLGMIESARETETLALSVEDSAGVVIVPALAGLGAPYWNAEARGAILGLTRGAGRAHIARAALEAQAYQTHDLLKAMQQDGHPIRYLRVDGAMVENSFMCNDLSDVLNVNIDRPKVIETTALGAAILAAIGSGHLNGLDDAQTMWRLDAQFTPKMDDAVRARRLAAWADAVSRINQKPPAGGV
jgi:glycerol kinase